MILMQRFCAYFYPRSPCGERLVDTLIFTHTMLFLSTLSLRRATPAEHHANSQQEFLSTLSLRRATLVVTAFSGSADNFYPRSPCGERQGAHRLAHAPPEISIHALLAESDIVSTVKLADPVLFLSTLSLRRATRDERHASTQQEFLSTLSLRRATNQHPPGTTSTTYFYPRSPCGERQ